MHGRASVRVCTGVTAGGRTLTVVEFRIESYDERGEYLAARTQVGPGEDDCWLWTLKPDRDGYGVAFFGGRQWRAHRLSYTHHGGEIPAGYELDHTCEVRLCVRPSHLEPVESNFENFVRKYLREGRTRAVAEQLAQWDVEQIEKEHQLKLARRAEAAAVATAVAAGAGVGAKVRRGATNRGARWTVTGIRAGEGGVVFLDVEAEGSGYRDFVELEAVRPA